MKTKRMISFVIALAMIVSLFAVVPVSAGTQAAAPDWSIDYDNTFYDGYVGKSILADYPNVGSDSGNAMRKIWSRIAGGNDELKIGETTENGNYMEIGGITGFATDDNWAGAWKMSVDFSNSNPAANHFQGFLFNFDTNGGSDSSTPVYGKTSGATSNIYVGNSGIKIAFSKDDTNDFAKIYVTTVDNETYSAIEYTKTFALGTFTNSGWANLSITDTGSKFSIKINNELIAYIEYSNSETISGFRGAGYRTATIYDAAGTQQATTDKAYIATKGTLGFATRTGNLCVDNISIGVDTSVPVVVTNAGQIQKGETKLTQDITGTLSVSSGDYVIDLAGHSWTSVDTQALFVEGSANVKIIDSVGGGYISTSLNDTIQMTNGTLTTESITISCSNGGGDAFFVDGGTVNIIDCAIYANKAGIDVSQNGSSATVNVNGCTFGGAITEEERTCAIELRNDNKIVTLDGEIIFADGINRVMRRLTDDGGNNNCTVAPSAVIKAGANSTITFGDDSSVTGRANYKQNTITYTYAPAPSFDSYSVTLGTDLALNFYVNNATETTEVKFEANGEELEYALGEDGAYVLVFGPHQTATEVTATLIVDGETVDTVVASIDGYLDQLKTSDSTYSDKVDAIQMYANASELYVNAEKDDTLIADIDAMYTYCPVDDKFAIDSVPSSNPENMNPWISATLVLENDIKIRLNTGLTAGEVIVTDEAGEIVDTLTISQDGTVEFSVTPGNIYTNYRFVMMDSEGVVASNYLYYSVDTYIARTLNVNEYPVWLQTLLKSIAVYGYAFSE